MTMMPSMLRFCALAVFGLVMLSGAQALAQTVDNGCTDINGVRLGDCSRLDKNNGRVTIRATDCGNPDSTVPDCTAATAAIYSPATEAAAQCRTIYNADQMDYFVPWKTAEEWGKFLAWVKGPGVARGLKIHQCCVPTVGTVCANQIYSGTPVGAAGLPVTDPATGNPIQLGKRVLGVRSGGVGDYGAQSDVSELLDTAALLGDSTINYKVTYVCNAGSWVKTFEEGSCTPMDGACGASVPTGGVTSNQLAALQQQNLLCTDGSLMRNLVDHSTYWTWECQGTPGRATANCNVASLEINNGSAQCGTASFGRLASPPATAAQLCTLGTPSGVGGAGTQADPWNWVCNGTFGSFQSCRAYSNTALMDGMCGSSNGVKTGDSSWNPGTGAALCGNGTKLTAAGITTTATGWNWSCAGENGGVDKVCQAELSATGYVGNCGSVDASAGTTPPTGNLCDVGVPSAITYGPAYQNDGRMAWLWTCIGTAAPPCSPGDACAALGYDYWCQKYDTNGPQVPACGWSTGYAYYGTATPTPSILNLCSNTNDLVGTPVFDTSQFPPQWTWVCQGKNGGGTINCQTNNKVKNGLCNYNTSSLTVTATTPLPANACGLGQIPINEAISGTTYTYQCPGVWGGTTTSCTVGYDAGLVKAGICGYYHNTQMITQPQVLAGLCSYGVASGSGSKVGATWVWTCQGTAGTAPTPCATIYNSTSTPPTGTNGVCGTANGSVTTTAPTTNLCSVGTASAVSGTGPWTWSCAGSSGGTNAVCTANPPASPGAGLCGSTHGTRIPSQPNTNLCAGGSPSAVSGTGPWTWQCIGTTTVSCSADPCDTCAGDLPGATKSATFTNLSLTYGGGLCTVNGTANWTQIDTLDGSNATQDLTLGHSASGLSFSKSVVPPAAPLNYCPPCYRRAKTITGSFTVQKSGTCTGSSLDSGAPATIAIDNVQIQ